MKTILVIDDSRFLQLAIDKALREAGYRTLLVSDGEAGLRMAIQRRPDLVLLDVMLPSLPGTSVLHSLRHSPVTSGIPIIVLTGLTRLDESRLRGEGADCFFPKSDLNLENGCPVLMEAIQKLLHQQVDVV